MSWDRWQLRKNILLRVSKISLEVHDESQEKLRIRFRAKESRSES